MRARGGPDHWLVRAAKPREARGRAGPKGMAGYAQQPPVASRPGHLAASGPPLLLGDEPSPTWILAAINSVPAGLEIGEYDPTGLARAPVAAPLQTVPARHVERADVRCPPSRDGHV